MRGFVDDIEKLTEENADYRRGPFTGGEKQVGLWGGAPRGGVGGGGGGGGGGCLGGE